MTTARPDDDRPPRRGAAGRVRRPRLPRRLGLEGVPGDTARCAASRCRPACARATACPSRSSRRRRRRPGPARREHHRSTGRHGVELVGDGPSAAATVARAVRGRRRGRAGPGSSSPTRSSSSGPARSGELILIDEVLTPDSSRFWDADDYEPGRAQASYDKQFVRDWLETQPWDKTAPGPGAPGRRRRRHPRAGTSRPSSGSPGRASPATSRRT